MRNQAKMNFCRTCGLVVLLAILAGCRTEVREAKTSEDYRIRLFSNTEHTYTNEWWLPESRIKTLPKWEPGKAEIPLPLDNALEIATRWVAARVGSIEGLERVTIAPIHPDEEEFRHTFYYQFLFGVSPAFNHKTCIVLTDGSVLEPERPR